MSERNANIEDEIMDRVARWRPPFDPDHSSAKRRVLERINIEESGNSMKLRRVAAKSRLRAAASVLLLVLAGFVIYFLSMNSIVNTTSTSKVVLLPGGSEVILSPKSKVSYNSLMWLANRSVKFEGEGYFKVFPGKPFEVNTGEGQISVHGTRFTVWTDPQDLFVHCNTGRVSVTRGEQSILLEANEFTQVERNRLSTKIVYESNGFISPRESNHLTFKSVPAGIVVRELEKVLGTEIQNNLPANLIYTGILDIRNKNQCLEVFCKPFGATFTENANGDVSIQL